MNIKNVLNWGMAATGGQPSGSQGSGMGSVKPPPELRRRNMGPILAIVIVVVLIIAGVGIYIAFLQPKKATAFTVSSYASFTTANTNTPITFYAGASIANSNISSITWNFGNGYSKTYTGATGVSVSYPYADPGSYFVQATVHSKTGAVASNSLSLIPVSVTPDAASIAAAAKQYPASVVVMDSSSSGKNLTYGFTSVVALNGYVNVTGQLPVSFSLNPTATNWSLVSMTIASGKTTETFNASQVNNGDNWVNFTYSSEGLYPITVSALTSDGTSNSTWTYIQTAAAGALSPKFPATTTHSGIIDATWFPGGFSTIDPAIAYDTVSYEPVYNVYSPLIQYSPGTSSSSFMPVIATTVPTLANHLETSVTANNVTYVNYTFPINTAEKFADGNPVTPYDVYFSVVRSLLFANDPGRPGWLLAHALVPGASIYGPFNVSTFWINHAITYNATSVTFHILPTTNQSVYGVLPSWGTNGAYFYTGTAENNTTALADGFATTSYDTEGSSVYFMQIMTQPVGFVMEASWANSSGAGIGSPPFTDTEFYNYQQYGNAASWNTNLQFGSMGTGPYVINSLEPGQFITFKPNPNYVQPNSNYPAPSSLEPSITIYYYNSQSVAQQAFSTGAADFAEAAYPPTSMPSLLPLVQKGQAALTSTLQLSYFSWFFNLQINVSALQSLTTQAVKFPASSLLWENASGVQTSASAPGSWEVSNFFANLSTRRAFIYSFDQAQYIAFNTNSGISFAQNQTGYLPQGISNYPTNISDPTANPYVPNLNMALASQYWNQTPWHTLGAGSITFPIYSITGSPIQDKMVQIWTQDIKTATNGVVVPYLLDINFATLLTTTAVPSAQNPLPIYFLGWIDDYPDPTDFAAPMAQQYGIYSFPDGLFSGPGFNSSTNPHQWQLINQMWNVSAQAAGELNQTNRTALYWQSDYIYNELGLQAGAAQTIGVVYYRTNIVASSLAMSEGPEASLSFLILFPVQTH